jgi:lysophospholipase L1-like esterase
MRFKLPSLHIFSRSSSSSPSPSLKPPIRQQQTKMSTPSPPAGNEKTPFSVLAFGDSLTEGYSRVRHRKLRILCFGASLTEGYTQYGTQFTPYSKWLWEGLEQELLSDGKDSKERGKDDSEEKEVKVENIIVDTDGMSGDLVTGGFKRRMGRHCKLFYLHISLKLFHCNIAISTLDTDGPSRTEETPYDWVLFLGGTNDLGYGLKPTEIFTAIRDVIGIPLSYGARILLITIPECAAKSTALDMKRNELNEMMKEEARKNDCV